eukprot:jgi/Ulvmu1/11854/UM081_0012.1
MRRLHGGGCTCVGSLGRGRWHPGSRGSELVGTGMVQEPCWRVLNGTPAGDVQCGAMFTAARCSLRRGARGMQSGRLPGLDARHAPLMAMMAPGCRGAAPLSSRDPRAAL